ncbi:MAG: hypothetical protein WC936_06535 [Candidatus Nanoarchaeia archaeon]|jgi:hypothetical protein
MADITAFPAIHNVLYSGDNIQSFTASGAITAGQVVAIDATGVTLTVRAAVAESGERPVGVAIMSAASGAQVPVAMTGCIVCVANADDGTDIDAGEWLTANINTVGGTVSAQSIAAESAGLAALYDTVVGFAVGDIPKSSYGLMMVNPQTITRPNAS